jgi:hypothetical protein
MDLCSDLRVLPAFADGAEVGAEVAAAAIDAVAVLASLFVEESDSLFYGLGGGGLYGLRAV